MDTTDFGSQAEKSFTFLVGLVLIFWCPLFVFISQVGAAIREIALNSRKEEFSSESDYKSLQWLSYILFFLAWFSLLFGIIFILKAGWPS